MAQVPKLIACVGIHGSASTLVYNIVRETLLLKFMARDIVTAFVNVGERNVTPLLGADLVNKCVLLKMHDVSAEFNSLIWLSDASVFLSIRDPRDALLSRVQRFNTPLDVAIEQMVAACDSVCRLAELDRVIILKYEDRFFENVALPQRLAHEIGIELSLQNSEKLAKLYSAENVKAFAERLSDLPAHRLQKAVGATTESEFDLITQIHRTHIGDGRVGKWRELLDERQRQTISRQLEPFLKRFGYD